MSKRIMKYDVKKSESFSELTQKFISVKIAQGMSERTINDYIKHFKRFKKYCNNDIWDLEIIKQNLINFFTSLSSKAPTTYNVPYGILNTFFNWCISETYLSINPLKILGLKKKKDEGKARHINEEIITSLIDIIDISTYAGLRDYAIVLFTLDTGIRPKRSIFT